MDSISHGGISQALYLSAWFFGSYLYHGLGVTLGYHRLLTHKSLVVPAWLKWFIVSGGYLCLMGSPITWVGVHRLHHQKSDLEGDPHSPRDGFWHALVGWMTHTKDYQSDDELRRQCKDLTANSFIVWLGDDHGPRSPLICLGACIVFRVLLCTLFGPAVMAANLAATGMTFLSTQLVNAVCHLPRQGYRSEETIDDSRNVWWVGILALGEGWHNNHHAMPTSARHGVKWYEIDVTWYTIWILEKLGLSKNVIRPVTQPVRVDSGAAATPRPAGHRRPVTQTGEVRTEAVSVTVAQPQETTFRQ